ncbi:MAG: alkaline phosphatase family protein [Anaerolineales bacterium]|nr:alkaline phosphatase family protein [Anaerolineales bacterium]
MNNLLDEFFPPNYVDGSIANVPATIASLLNVPFVGLPPLRGDLWQPLAGDVRRVVLLIIDSLGWQMVEKERPLFDELMRGETAVLHPITSIFPSTTVAALSSFWTGVGPAQHGLAGLRLLIPEYGTVTQFINFTPDFGSYPNALVGAGMKPEEFLDAPGVAEQLQAANMPTYRFKGYQLVASALSKMHGRGVKETFATITTADMFVQMRNLLEEKAGESMYMAAYWPTIDTMMHRYGWNHPAVAVELQTIFRQLKEQLLQPLSEVARAGTVFLLAADHGQIICPPAHYVHYDDHPQLAEMLLIRPTGEPRLPYFHARQGRQQDVLHYLQDHFAETMLALTGEEALAAGLLGPQPHSSETAVRVGDVVGLMRHDYAFVTAQDLEYADRLYGRHGGMTRLEMQVPFLGMRLDRQ